MTSIAAAAATDYTAPSETRKATMNYDSFLRLLVAEMKNQDPTKPKDSTQYMAQLASFSSVEQGINMNKKLEALMRSMSLSEANSVIGRSITSKDGSLSGVVKAVEIGENGSVAILTSGARIDLQPGVVIMKSEAS